MVGPDRVIEVEWIVACTAPRDVAPHPNFSVENVRPAELLALLVELEFADYEHYRRLLDEAFTRDGGVRTVDMELLNAARMSLDSETVHEGMRRLIQIGRDESASIGMRSAAAFLGSLAGSDTDNLGAPVDLLREIFHQLPADDESATPSTALFVRAAIAQQIAIRSLEIGNYDEAQAFAEAALAAVKNLRGDWEDFQTSKGISWSAAESQHRVSSMLELNSKALFAATQEDIERSWVEIVRSKPPAGEVRPTREAARGLMNFLDEKFKADYSSGSVTRTFRNADPVLRPLYASLINAEMLGSLDRIRQMRQVVGRVQAIRATDGADRESSLRESLRLLRQADAEDAMKRVLRQLRLQGPLQLLREAAIQVLDRSEGILKPGPIDLATLEAAADMLGPKEKTEALRLAFDFPASGSEGRLRRRGHRTYQRIELGLKAAAALAPDSSAHDYAARRALELSETYSLTRDQTKFASLVRLASAIAWDEVSPEARSRWRDLLEGVEPDSEVLASDVFKLARALGNNVRPDVSVTTRGLERVVALINGWISDPTTEDVTDAAAMCLEALNKLEEEANSGIVTGYFYSPMALAGYLIAEYGRGELWGQMMTVLRHPTVAAFEKSAALNALASKDLSLSDEMRARLANMMPSPPVVDDIDPLFTGAPGELDAAWRNFLLAQGIASLQDMQMNLVRLSANSDPDVRARVALTLSLAVRTSLDADWPVILLLQLSHDTDPIVRHRAAQGLSYISGFDQLSLAAVIRERTSELLHEPGVSVVLGALRGLLDYLGEENRARRLWCFDAVENLAKSHISRHVRSAAGRAIRDETE